MVAVEGRRGCPDQAVPWKGGHTPREGPHEEAPSNDAPSRESLFPEGRPVGEEEEGGPHEEAPSNGAPSPLSKGG